MCLESWTHQQPLIFFLFFILILFLFYIAHVSISYVISRALCAHSRVAEPMRCASRHRSHFLQAQRNAADSTRTLCDTRTSLQIQLQL